MPEITSLDEYRRSVRGNVPHLFEFLTRAEFQTCWAIVFVAGAEEYEGAFDLGDYVAPGAPESLEERFRSAIRYLADNGWTFKGLSLDGWEIVGHLPPIEPRNLAYFLLFKQGSMPSPIVALEGAIGSLAWMNAEDDIEKLRDALQAVREEKAKELLEQREERWN